MFLCGALNSLTERSTSDTRVFEGLRVFSFCYVFLFHIVCVSSAVVRVEEYSTLYDFINNRPYLVCGYLFVHFFLITSGFLTMRELMNRKKWTVGQLTTLWLLRIVRILPVFYAMIAIKRIVLPQTCELDDLLMNLFFVNNYHPAYGGSCNIEAWTVPVDIHSLFILLVIYKVCDQFKLSMKKALISAVLVALAIRLYVVYSQPTPLVYSPFITPPLGFGDKEHFWKIYNSYARLGIDVPPITDEGYNFLAARQREGVVIFAATYNTTHVRFGSLLLGALLAIYYNEVQRDKNRRKHWLRVPALYISMIGCLYHMYYCAQAANSQRVAYNQFHFSVEHISFPVLFVYFMYYLLTVEHGEPLHWFQRLLQNSNLLPFAKLSYCMYLSSLVTIGGMTVYFKAPNYMLDVPYVFKLYVMSLFVNCLFAILLYSFVEYPGLVFRSYLKKRWDTKDKDE